MSEGLPISELVVYYLGDGWTGGSHVHPELSSQSTWPPSARTRCVPPSLAQSQIVWSRVVTEVSSIERSML